MTFITTVPNVSYKCDSTRVDLAVANNPADFTDGNNLEFGEEPFIKASVISKAGFIGASMSLCIAKRVSVVNQHYLTADRVELIFEMPLAEIVFDCYDKLKTISKGYASFDYHPIGYRQSTLVKLDIRLNGEPVDALSSLIPRDRAYDFGKKICEKPNGQA